jgi:MOSC domain-containing protein YiiM/catechol 2,3-dioxygenase-like lactoylglutathione lyase family enzyme
VSDGLVHQVSSSKGGVPKLPLEVAEVTELGVAGDRQAQLGIHGGPKRALCLFALELIEELRAGGHPIVPGGAGENVTTAGIDWSLMRPGRRLLLGDRVRIELTGFAAPCRTIAHNFADGYFNRISEQIAPGRSRVYAKVLEAGTLRPGDRIVLEGPAPARAPADLFVDGIGEIGVHVSDLAQAAAYYRDVLGLEPDEALAGPGIAGFSVGNVDILLASDAGGIDAPPTGTLAFSVGSIEEAARRLAARGVDFEAGPLLQSKQGGIEVWVAYFHDPGGNRLALVEERLPGS